MHNAFRDGRIHVCAYECQTCVFRKGNLMHLHAGRVRSMVDEAQANDSAIICHKTLGGDNAICRGFADRYPTLPLRLATAMNLIELDNPDMKEQDS